MASPPNVARPLALVVALADATVAPLGPDAITAVTTTFGSATGLPLGSCTWTAGCVAKATPLCAAADGCVTIASRARASASPPPRPGGWPCAPALARRVWPCPARWVGRAATVATAVAAANGARGPAGPPGG